MKRIFISFPYSHSDPKVIEERLEIARKYALFLINKGKSPLSPALTGHDIITNLKVEQQDMTFVFWEEFCYSYLEICDEFHILQIDGWRESLGVAGEQQKATILGKHVKYVHPNGFVEIDTIV